MDLKGQEESVVTEKDPEGTEGTGPTLVVAGEEAPLPVDPPAAETDPNILGTMEPHELAMMTALRQQARGLVTRIGELEVEKARILGQVARLEDQTQNHLQGVGKRLNIPQGMQWQVTADGKLRKIPQPPVPFGIPGGKAAKPQG